MKKTENTKNAQGEVKKNTKGTKANKEIKDTAAAVVTEAAASAAAAIKETNAAEQPQEQPQAEQSQAAPAAAAQEQPQTEAKKGLQPMPKFATYDEACDHIKGLDNNDLFKFARRLRITWTGTNNDGINRMRCMMAIKDYYRMNLPKAV